MALGSQLTCTLSALLLAATGIIVIVPGSAQAATPGPRPVIVFEDASDQGLQVVGADANGNRQRRLTSGPNMAETPRWGPFGQRILYLRSTASGRRDLMVMGPRGRDKHQLLYGKHRFITDMAWGPRGGRIALVMSPRRTADFTDVYMFSLDTRKLTRLHANSFPDRDVATLDWSRDGRTIAFSAVDYTEDGDDFEDHDLYLIRPDGSGLRQITNTSPLDELNPRFSPDGDQLAYSKAPLSSPGSVMIAAADGTNPRRLPTGRGTAHQGSWSSDGGQLLVEKYDRQGSEVIWRMTSAGTDRRFLMHGRNASWRPR